MFRTLIIVVCFFTSTLAIAQQSQPTNDVIEKYGPRRQISTIVYMGLAGAVLGLSTLSFEGRPQDKLTNIPIGFGVGVIIGTIYMTYQAAANPNEFYKASYVAPDFNRRKTVIKMGADSFRRPESSDFTYQWTF